MEDMVMTQTTNKKAVKKNVKRTYTYGEDNYSYEKVLDLFMQLKNKNDNCNCYA